VTRDCTTSPYATSQETVSRAYLISLFTRLRTGILASFSYQVVDPRSSPSMPHSISSRSECSAPTTSPRVRFARSSKSSPNKPPKLPPKNQVMPQRGILHNGSRIARSPVQQASASPRHLSPPACPSSLSSSALGPHPSVSTPPPIEPPTQPSSAKNVTLIALKRPPEVDESAQRGSKRPCQLR
jgi:hypothetical protein